jgi:membrane protein DedA with SNARE-associated domain
MMPHLVLRILPLLATYGYSVILPIAVVEGPAVTIIAGALVAAGQFDPVLTCVLLVIADLIGDVLYYSLGRFAHAPLLEKLSISKRLSKAAEKVRPLEQRFREHDWKLLMLGKTQALGSLILYMAGASRVPFWRYMLLNLIGTLPKVILFQTIGYLLGRGILSSTHYVDMITLVTFGAAFLLLLSYILFKRLASKDVLQVTAR